MALGAKEAIFLFVVLHVLNPPDLPLEFLCFPALVICRLNKAHLSVLLQEQIILQTFISGICGHFLIPGLLFILQVFQERN